MITDTTTPAPSATLGERVRRDWPWVVILVVVVVTAAVLIVAKLTGDDYQTAVGSVYYDPDQVTGYRSYVELPVGRVQITVSKPHASVENYEVDARRPAPEDGSFIGFAAHVTTTHVVPTTGSDEAPLPRFSLLAGGRAYPVPPDPLQDQSSAYAIELAQSAWVGVAGSPHDVQVVIDYAGVRQVVDASTGRRSTGRAAPLYRHLPPASATDTTSCGTATLTSGYRPRQYYSLPTCMYSAADRLPYVAGLGWAPAGKAWLAIGVSTDSNLSVENTGRGARGSYNSVDGDVLTSLDVDGQHSNGDPDTNRLSVYADASGVSGQQVGIFSVADSPKPVEVDVVITYRRLVNEDEPPAPRAPVDPTVRASWTVSA